jgi:uncharacterized damage-inducible protein DinB
METANNQTTEMEATAQIITPDQLLAHLQGHRKLTRKVIEAFPEDQLYTFSVGGMRPFAQLVMEIIVLAGPGINGLATGNWSMEGKDLSFETPPPATKQEVLELWDQVHAYTEQLWPLLTLERFQEPEKAFGMWEGTVQSLFLYMVDNEIHHRAQAYVYLRALGIEPPAFWDR